MNHSDVKNRGFDLFLEVPEITVNPMYKSNESLLAQEHEPTQAKSFPKNHQSAD